jgi:hypothetical protein
MGRKKLEYPSAEQINSMIVPAHVLAYFEIWS